MYMEGNFNNKNKKRNFTYLKLYINFQDLNGKFSKIFLISFLHSFSDYQKL